MGTIRVEYVPVQRFGLGFLGFDHLHLVYEDETSALDSQDFWYVLEGVQDGLVLGGTLGALGEDGTTSLAAANDANRDALIAKIGTPDDRGSRILATGPSVINLWNQMAAYGGDIEDQRLPYIAFTLPFSASPTINSTSFIASVLWSVGIDLSLLAPFGIRNSPGASTLIGTSDADNLVIDGGFTTLVGGFGDDQLSGTTNTLSIERFYGGEGDDTITWSQGDNIIHGGQPRLSYAADGLDTVDYSGAGQVFISANRYVVEHKIATHIAQFNGGEDNLFSIEQIAWDRENDVIIAGEGVSFLERPVLLDLKGDDGGRGDQLGFSGTTEPLIINSVGDGTHSFQTVSNSGLDAGYWALSAETIIGSDGDDQIYAGANVLTVDGGEGNDIVDGRLSAAFTGLSENGYDVELFGGDGDDTIVSGTGRTLAQGGDGADVFVLSAMTIEERVEFVIDDADADDTLYLPYNFFQATRGEFDGSRLLQVSGAAFKIDDVNTQSFFLWGNPGPSFDFYEFVGAIQFTIEGSDLIIKPVQGNIEEITQNNGPGEPPGPTFTVITGDGGTEVTIRVRNWSEGILGINFPLTFDLTQLGLEDDFYDYPGLRDVVSQAITPSRFLDALEQRPEAYTPLEIANAINAAATTVSRQASVSAAASTPPVTIGSDSDDVLFADDGGPYTFEGRGGADTITGSRGGDVLDGGVGADILRGLRGNDVYIVDNVGDVTIEEAGGGFDHVISSIDYSLGAYVEHLTLTGTADLATGNDLNNTLSGSDANNRLSGGGGDDTLAGNLGDDTLIGGLGGDAYVYELGDGRDIIIDATDASGADDVLLLLGTLRPSDVTLIRNPNAMSDLILAFGDGGRITIKDHYAGVGAGIDGITFGGGETWTTADIVTRAEAALITSNTAPIARDDVFTLAASGPIIISRAALLQNDADFDGDVLSVVAVDRVIGGTAVVNANGDIEITSSTATGTALISLTYTISDGQGGSSQATLDVSLRQNTPARIISTTLTPVIEDQNATGAIIATDVDGDALIFGIKSGFGPSKGIVSIANDGSFAFTPFANANGAEGFIVTVSDGKGETAERAVSFEIAAQNDVPLASNDGGFRAVGGQTLVLSASRLLANDSDVDGDVLATTGVRAAFGGVATLTANGDVTFVVDPRFTGQASFIYDITDGQGGTASATAVIDVTAPITNNGAPLIRSSSLPQVREDQAAKGRIIASDPDGDVLTYAIKDGAGPLLGAVRFESEGRFTYTPDANKNGDEHFIIKVSDGRGGVTDVPFAFTVRAVNDGPLAQDDRLAAIKSGTLQSFSEAQLLANDVDSDGDRLDIISISNVTGGLARLTDGGDVLFYASRGFFGEAQFSYRISDAEGGKDTATVSFQVTRGGGHGDGVPGNSGGSWHGIEWNGNPWQGDKWHFGGRYDFDVFG